ncbi:MAG: NnrU family protein [Xanthobacteraceae bacterium]
MRITRHPRLCGVSLWAIAHLLVNGQLAALFMFGALLVTAVNGMVSIDRKRRRTLGALWGEFESQTSRLPFAAILTGRIGFELAEFQVWQVALAVALFLGVFWLLGIMGPSPLWAVRA